ncbi:ORF17 [callitrichine gammaherpesvirus 3]|uniref:ORF17 n=1 Tax=callitrichine gammaherpesvirus 3 TaxID=106331 RepID=Q993J3_9GAMA|nr:ORF17 [callitrichine gammaherpesvirus 3]AAK38225.1 ORF17 [callitrichine gammaherpesvirus 3]
MASRSIENRPFPYLSVDTDLLTNLKQSAAEGLFHSFDVLVGKDARESGIRFEVLLGVYTNAIQYVRFLETALALSCVNTEFKDLSRMTDGKIQFRISVPTIAHGDGRRPSKQRTYIVLKNCHKHHISTEMELSMQDLEILHSIPETPVEYAEYVGAVKTVAYALKFGVDALERGLVDTVLSVKLRHAPPMFILQTLSDPTFSERGLPKTVKSDLIAMFKRHLLEHSFFLDRADYLGGGAQQYVRQRLSEMVGAVSGETVLKGVTTYTTENGDPVGGVFIVTDNVLRNIMMVLGETSDSKILGPAAYASFVVRGENLVTAISYGRVMRTFENFMSRIVDRPEQSGTPDTDLNAVGGGTANLPRVPLTAATIRLGKTTVAVESLQKMYSDTQCPYPLNRRMQYSYYFPVGLFQQNPKYTTSTSVKILDNPIHQLPVETWIVNKNNLLLAFNLQNCLKVLCHPRVHTPAHTLNALNNNPNPRERMETYSLAHRMAQHMNLFAIIQQFYEAKRAAPITDIALKCAQNMDDFLHPSNHDLLRLELHPLFDIYLARDAAGKGTHHAVHRIMVGNLPPPLAPAAFHEARGLQFEAATGLTHVVDQTVVDVVQDTAFDTAYPVLFYLVECMIHGNEEKFTMNMPLISLCINTYWEVNGRLAFINSFSMIQYICRHLGNNAITKEAYQQYRKIMGELIALEQALLKLAGTDVIGGDSIGEYVDAILDPNLLPPFTYHDIFTHLLQNSDRRPQVIIGREVYQDAQDRDQYVERVGDLQEMAVQFANLYGDRVNRDHDQNFRLRLAPLPDENRTQALEKIFYYGFLPACTGGHLCGMGVDFEHAATVLAYNGPVFGPNMDPDESIMTNLENGTLRDVIAACDVRPTIRMIRDLCASFLTCPVQTQAARVVVDLDVTQQLTSRPTARRMEQTVLVNGFVAFAFSERSRQISESFLYAVPFHVFYSDPRVAATLNVNVANFVMRNPQQRSAEAFNRAPELFAEYREWHRSPMVSFAASRNPSPVIISAMVAMHTKLAPISFIAQAKHKIHPGVALTVVRTDEVLSENILFSARASTSMFIGNPNVCRKEARVDAVTFEVHHEMASIDTGLAYSSTMTPARVAAITTDMGIHTQDFFSVFPTEVYADQHVNDFIRQRVGVQRTGTLLRDPRTYIAGVPNANSIPGLSHGQLATCEIILTPVTADVAYFQKSNSPRGRAACVVSCDNYSPDEAEKLIYDHSRPDPAYEFRSTVNPWASQLGSLGDVMYNSSYRQTAVPGLHSPCRAFFNKEELLKYNRGLYNMVSEYSQRLGSSPATSNTEIQFVVIAGTDMFLEQPCCFLQEAFPALSASTRALIDEFMSSKVTHAPVHYGHYLIEEVAPVRRVFKFGNKLVY